MTHDLGTGRPRLRAVPAMAAASLMLLPAGSWAQATTGPATAQSYMVAAANPLAVAAGVEMLREGGSAIDAMVATQMVLNLVEPQSSGIGGGAFLVYHDVATGETITLDGRETAPMTATPALFLQATGEPMGFWDAVVGGRSVGTPGTLALMETAHARFGTLPWDRLFEPAIALAEDGFEVSPRLSGMLGGDAGERLRTFATARDYFFPGGEPLQAGDTLQNPDFAATLRLIAAEGSAPFYTGEIAADIVATVQAADPNPGLLAMDDLAAYRVIERAPVCQDYRGYSVCGMGPPSSGALTVGQILGLLGHFDLPSLSADNPLAWHLIAEASKLAFADRGLYMADSDFVTVPVDGLLDPRYLTARAQRIALTAAMATPAAPGNPPFPEALPRAPDRSQEQPGTSHVSIVDAAGNAVSLTTTIESAWGSNLMVRGFLLNNELTDFSFVAEENGLMVANRVEPGKRPRSSMSPSIVFDPDGAVHLVVGSPGGSRIIGYVAQTIVAVLDWDMDIQSAINLPRIVNRNGPVDLEEGTAAEAFAGFLEARGHAVNVRGLTSGLHGIQITDDGLEGGADPRREGIALGD